MAVSLTSPAASAKGPEPRPPPRTRAAEKRLPCSPSPVFHLMWNPERWYFDPETSEWLPGLGYMRGDPGCGGVDKGGDDVFARVEVQRRGWNVLPWDVLADMRGGWPYIKQYDCRGGVYHCEFWETPRFVGNRMMESATDAEGRREFLRELMRVGIIPPPDPVLLSSKVEAERAQLQRILNQPPSAGQAQAQERYEGQVAAMTEAIGDPGEPQTLAAGVPEMP